jgi:hypothetical protein
MLPRLPVQGIREFNGRPLFACLSLLTVRVTLYDILFFSQSVFCESSFPAEQRIARQGHFSGGDHAVF